MTREQQQVMEFMRLAGQECPERPAAPIPAIQDLRWELIKEELSELNLAMVCQDLTEIADALADLLYVVYGAGVAYGIDLEPVFQEVHRSNMSKFVDGHKDAGGKWIKGPSYSPANLGPILKEQGAAV